MNPWPMVRADLRAMGAAAWIVVALVALAVALGIAVGAQERGLRQASARAADDFDLLIGAAGSQTQLVLTTVYLQPQALPLIPGSVLSRLAADPRVAGFAPLAFGDVVRGYPVIGTTVAFASRWGRAKLAEGRMFAAEEEVVIGAGVRLALGDAVTPAHATAGGRHAPGAESDEEHAHRHEGVHYRVVGRLPPLGSPWDRAILVPIESVWETHGLGNGHAAEGPIGPPFDAGPLPPVPAVVVKPRTIADAYALRGAFRGQGTMALFPAEVLVDLYRTMGDLRDVLLVASVLNNLLLFAAVLLLMATLVSLRRRRYAVLRALGAPARYVLAVTWLGATLLIGAGCAAGLLLGWLAAVAVGGLVAARTGLAVPLHPGLQDIGIAAALIAAGGVLAMVPALLAYRAPVASGLRGE